MPIKVRIRGEIYPSLRAAAAAFNTTPKRIVAMLDAGREDDIPDLEARSNTVKITIDGVTYPSLRSAARAKKVTPSTLAKAKERGLLDNVGKGKAAFFKEVEYNGAVYASIKDAALANGVSRSTVARNHTMKKSKENTRHCGVILPESTYGLVIALAKYKDMSVSGVLKELIDTALSVQGLLPHLGDLEGGKDGK
jgi:hypothetical protein